MKSLYLLKEPVSDRHCVLVHWKVQFCFFSTTSTIKMFISEKQANTYYKKQLQSRMEKEKVICKTERLLLTHEKTPGFLASREEEFNLGSETRLDCSEILCNKVLLNYKWDRESFWHRHQKGAERVPPC